MSVLVYVSGRADFTLLLPSIRALRKRVDTDVMLGTDAHAEVHRAISMEGCDPFVVTDPGERVSLFRATFDAASSVIADHAYAYALCYGDRAETLAFACAASVGGVPIAHIEGGDITLGGLQDDRARGSITALSTLHFPTTAESATTLEQHGIARSMIEVCGIPSLSLGPDELDTFAPSDKPVVMLTLQPMPGDTARNADVVLDALDFERTNVIAFQPCRDPGHEVISEAIAKRCELVSWPPRRFLGLLRAIGTGVIDGCMVGNSSAGLKEAPAFGVPVVNIGNRQRGRLRSVHVLDVEHNTSAIECGLRVALSPEFRTLCRISPSPYRAFPNSGYIVANRIMKEIKCSGR